MALSNKTTPHIISADKNSNNADSGNLAVRESRFSFQSKYLVNSNEFQELFKSRETLTNRIKFLSHEIVDLLFLCVKNNSDEKAAAKLIEIKRIIYNLRFIPESSYKELNLSAELLLKLSEYSAVYEEINKLFNLYSTNIEAEIEDNCRLLLTEDLFRASVEYSSPTISFAEKNAKTKFSKWLRKVSTIYAYALKHVTQTSSFYTFSRIYLPESKGMVIPDTFETVLNVELFFELESAFVKSVPDKSLLNLDLVTNWRTGSHYYFLIFRDNTVRVLTYKRTPLLEKIITFFAENEPNNTLLNYQKLTDFVSDSDSTEGNSLIEKLISDGVISPYIIENIKNPIKYLINSEPEKRDVYESLRKVNGQIIADDEIANEHQKIKNLTSNLNIKTSPPYIGYSYAGQVTDKQKKLANIFANDLTEISEVFQIENNNNANKTSVIEIIKKCFTDSGKSKMPFLELITRVMWVKIEEKPDSNDDFKDSSQKMNLAEAETLKMTGNLSQDNISKLNEISRNRDNLIVKEKRLSPVCIVGNPDFETPGFYVHNIFAGNARFIKKYFTDQSNEHFNSHSEPDDKTNVEIMPSWHIPQHRMGRSFKTGFSFDNRSRQLFDETIKPEDIEVVFNEIPVFIHRLTKKELKFHYCGLALFQRIPIPYKLLLFDQIDFFINIFQTPPRCERNQTVLLEELKYKSINLRRSCICLGIDLLKSCLAEKDWIRGAYFFRELLKSNFNVKSDYLYFRLIEKNYFIESPRFLNLLHPLSWDIFRRSILKYPATVAVHFTECSPLPTQMFQKSDGNYFTEFMIEI
jgi:hypothetical protein